jgi:hypothetical protein
MIALLALVSWLSTPDHPPHPRPRLPKRHCATPSSFWPTMPRPSATRRPGRTQEHAREAGGLGEGHALHQPPKKPASRAVERSSAARKCPAWERLRRGSDGHTAWAEDPINGLRVLKDAEAEDVRIAATWNSEWRLGEVYAKGSVGAPAGSNARRPGLGMRRA